MAPSTTNAVTPYYERDGAVIYLGDCREVLPQLPKAGVPYGVGYRSNYGGNFDAIAGDDDASGWVPEALALASEALRDKRHACIFGPRNLVAPPFRLAVELVWDKGALSMGDLSQPWYGRPAATRHPTEKPVPLLQRLIESSSLPGETVLDPFLGCGSTLVAAAVEGRKGIGIELDESYAETAACRVDKALDAMRGIAEAVA